MGPQKKSILYFKKKKEIASQAVRMWREISGGAIREKDFFTVALSGGRTPQPVYEVLAEKADKINWEKIHIFQADERIVPWNHRDSNWRMIRRRLLDTIPIPPANLHPVPVSEKDPAAMYESEIRHFFGTPDGGFPRFDLVILGMGEDGHTASLFPKTPALEEKKSLALSVDPPFARHRRVTLTYPLLNSAKNIIFIVTGRNKSDIVRRVLDERDPTLPATGISPRDGSVTYFLDPDTVGGLSIMQG